MSLADFQNSAFYLWLANNPDWLGLSIAAVSFIESFAVVGVLVPGVFMLYAITVLAGTGVLGQLRRSSRQ